VKTTAAEAPAGAAAIVHLASADGASVNEPAQRARAFAEPLLAGRLLDTGEDALEHADGTAAVLRAIGGGQALCAAAYLVYAGDFLQRPEEVVRKAFGDSFASLVMLTRQLMHIQRAARQSHTSPADPARRAQQTERVRKMLLAFSRDLRVVLLRLASRLQTLRAYAAAKRPCPPDLADESLHVFAPLANRLGVWQVKWEMEDLSFRFLEPETYQRVARLVDETRAERERGVRHAAEQLSALLVQAGLATEVYGRPKHLYGIWKKMQGKGLDFDRVMDARALRVMVADVTACYAALARLHAAWPPVDGEFSDYVARPKANGYQSLHTVVLGPDGRPLEVQIRTQAMHEHAEYGVAAHWMYKEAGPRGTAGVSASGPFEARMAEARKAVMRELLAWEQDLVRQGAPSGEAGAEAFDDRIYIFTPQATIVDLPVGGTPVDFAYALHTDLGHRCRGARVDGAMVPLNTALRSGQTVEVIAAKEGGPSLDWLNPELRYLASPRAKAKVRAWFNNEQQAQTIARGREAVERLLQRMGRTAIERLSLAEQLGFKTTDELFGVVGKDELSLRHIETLLRPAPAAPDERVPVHRPRGDAHGGGVRVVGLDSLLTALARCCRPAPPDLIDGFVTRGHGVAVHRRDCANLRQMTAQSPGRLIEVSWGEGAGQRLAVYALDVVVDAQDRPGLLRDISDVFTKERINVTDVHSQRKRDGARVWMTFTVEATDAARLAPVLAHIGRVAGVLHARRR
jgi:GTP pyrophosphokinase